MGGPVSTEFRDKLKSLHFQRPAARQGTKVTVDRHDDVTVTTTEHHNDRVDVHVEPQPLVWDPHA